MISFKLRTYIPLVLSVLLFACAAPQKTVYFREGVPNDSLVQTEAGKIPDYEGLIQPDDIVAINITSISSMTEKDPVSIFKDGGTPAPAVAMAGGVGGQSQNVSGYLVDKDGFIDFPVIGKIGIGGQTIRQAKGTIANKLKDYVKDPVVEVRITNYKVIILGEVTRPGTVLAPNHKINIIEAIAAAGDIPITGKKDNILVIRENGDHKEFARINLNSRDIFNSPYYYLKQNDIVYVEASKIRRQENNEFLRIYLPAFTTLLSTALAVFGIVQIVNNN